LRAIPGMADPERVRRDLVDDPAPMSQDPRAIPEKFSKWSVRIGLKSTPTTSRAVTITIEIVAPSERSGACPIMPRTIAIGDVHGCSKALQTVIEAIQPTAEDLIVTLGDYVDRGPDSRGVLDLLLGLRSRCRLVTILGNHDQMMLDVLKGGHPYDWFGCGGLEAINSYGPDRDLSKVPREHVEFLESCVDFFETDTHIFAHANFYDDIPMSEQEDAMLRWESLSWIIPGPHFTGKRAILGHTSQISGEILDLGHLVCIDTDCYGGGWLTALEVFNGETWQANRDGKLKNESASPH
jgi:serine/threonine protein phosphatase 1